MGSNPNTMDIKAVWDKQYQITHYKQPVYKAIASERLADQLQEGDTIHRTYASDFIVNDMGGDGSYSTQALVDTDETLVVNKKKEVSFYVPAWQQVQFHLPVTLKYARKAMNRLFNQVDGDILLNVFSNAGATMDDGDLGGTATNGINVSVGNVANIFYTATQKMIENNIIYDPNEQFSGIVKLDKTKVMPVAIIGAPVYNQLLQFLGGKNSMLGDKVSTNGHQGVFANWNVFVSNNLAWEATLTMSVQPTDADTVTIGGLVFTFKTVIGVTVGNVLIGATAATANTNLAALLAAPYTTTAQGVGFVQANITVAQQLMLANLTATNPTTTTTKLVVGGNGVVVVAQSMTSASNVWTATAQKQHNIFAVSGSIDLIIQKTPNLVINPVSGKIGKDFVTWNLYGFKVFKEQIPQIIDVQVQASAFKAPSNSFL